MIATLPTPSYKLPLEDMMGWDGMGWDIDLYATLFRIRDNDDTARPAQ
jgi:hypothetical protein